MPDQSLTYLHSDDGDTPADAGWIVMTLTGSGPVIANKGFQPADSGSAGAFVLRQVYYPRNGRESYGAPQRSRDRFSVQFTFEGSTGSPTWAASSPHVFYIDDGYRAIGLAIGPQLEWIDPYTGTVIKQAQGAYPWQQRTRLRIIKDRAARWQVWDESGRLIDQIGYEAAADSAVQQVPAKSGSSFHAFSAARVGWGRVDSLGTGTAYWDEIEVGCNTEVPPEWKVRRLETSLPAPMQSRWNRRLEAVARAMVGSFEEASVAIHSAWDLQTAAREVLADIAFTGDVLPDEEDVRWTAIGSSTTVVDDRLRIGGANVNDAYLWDFSAEVTPRADAVVRAGATFQLWRSFTFDARGRVGPVIQVRDGNRRINAHLLWNAASFTYGWALNDGDVVSGSLGNGGDVFWPVDPYEEHQVEIQVVGRTRVLLLVDDRIVDDVPYSRFTASTGDGNVRIGRAADSQVSVVCSMRHGFAEVSYVDLRTRPFFLQQLAERLIFVGGRERNDRLDLYGRHHRKVQAARGSYMGLRREHKRIAGDSVDLHEEVSPAAWYLNTTWPGITPVYLNAGGELTDVWVEYDANIPNFTPEAYCRIVKRYLAPVELVELEIRCALITPLTSVLVTTATETSFAVTDIDGFEAGDSVHLREELTGTVAEVTYTDTDLWAVDAAWAAVSLNGEVSGRFRLDAQGLGTAEYTGTFDRAGRSTTIINPITPGAAVNVVGAATQPTTFWLVGINSTTGLPDIEEITHSTGTTPGTTTWDAIYGAWASEPPGNNIAIRDASDSDSLITMLSTQRSRGGTLFQPALNVGPSTLRFVADAATTDPVLVVGIEELTGELTLEVVTLNGTTEVETTNSYTHLRWLGLGQLDTARTITVTTLGTHVTADLTVVSTSAADTMAGQLIAIDAAGEGYVEDFVLNGVTDVVLASKASRILGLRLEQEANGDVTLTAENALIAENADTSLDLALMEIAGGFSTAGFIPKDIPAAGSVQVALNQGASTRRWIGIYGRRADTGLRDVELVLLEGTNWIELETDWSEILGVATAALPDTKYVKVEGHSWFADTLRAAQAEVDGVTWTIANVPDPYAKLDYQEKTQGVETGIRDVKSAQHSKSLPTFPELFPATLTGNVSVALSDADNPIVESRPAAVNDSYYSITDAAQFLSDIWSWSTFTLFVRFKRISAGGTQGGFGFVVAKNTTTREWLAYNSSTGQLGVTYNGVANTQAVSVVNGTWHTAAVVMTAASSQLYFDGVATGGATAHGGASAAGVVAQLLRNSATDDEYDLADLVIYRRALTTAEIVVLDADTNGNDDLRTDSNLWAQYLDPQKDAPVCLLGGQIDLSGYYDLTESTQIQTVGDVSPLGVEVDPVVGAFTSAAVLRKEIE